MDIRAWWAKDGNRRIWIVAASGVYLTALIFVSTTIAVVRNEYRNKIVSQPQGQKEGIMVLGASLKPDGQPSDALRDRLDKGLELWKEGYADTILITGDDGQMKSDEVSVMHRYLNDRGVDDSHLTVDGHGYRTYESCLRARDTYSFDNLIIVTQNFHLPRALYLCNYMGIDAIGVSADLHQYKDEWWNVSRDWLASFKAWIDLNLWPPASPVKNA